MSFKKQIIVPKPEMFLATENYRAIKEYYIYSPSSEWTVYGRKPCKPELRQRLVTEKRSLNTMGESIWTCYENNRDTWSTFYAQALLKELGKI